MVDFSLKGKVALITGASYGIGFAIAKGMAGAGATIVFNDIKQELVDKGIAAYKEAGIEAHGYVCDVTNEEAVGEFVKKVTEEVGHINILIYNNGMSGGQFGFQSANAVLFFVVIVTISVIQLTVTNRKEEQL